MVVVVSRRCTCIRILRRSRTYSLLISKNFARAKDECMCLTGSCIQQTEFHVPRVGAEWLAGTLSESVPTELTVGKHAQQQPRRQRQRQRRRRRRQQQRQWKR